MKQPVVIRPLTETDKPTLADVYRETWTRAYAPILSDAGIAWMLANLDTKGISDIVPDKDERAYVAIIDESVVGSVVFAERHGIAYFWGMYIRPDFQRLGIGMALIRYGAERLGDGAILEAMILKTSPWAISFYNKLGFQGGDEGEFELAPGEFIASIQMSIRKETLLLRLG